MSDRPVTAASVLVVEDERITAKAIAQRLTALGYAVAGLAGTAAEAVRLAAEARPDLILMDINLGGGMDGVEAAGVIRARADVPVVYLTAYSDPDTLHRAKVTEPFGYVVKPYEDHDLQTAIEIGLYKHAMDRRLRENERWLAATLGSIGDGVIATDAAGRVRFLNAVAERLTGWASAAAAGADVRDVFRVVHETTRAPVANPALDALARGTVVELAAEAALVAADGTERPVADSAAPIRGADGRTDGAVLVFRDVTAERRMEEHLRQARKMEALGRLAGGIAHDFNNIMTVVTGFSSLLLAADLADADRRDYARAVHDAGRRAAALTQQIMAFSRRQVLMPAVLSLNAVVRDVGAMVRRLIGSNIAFVADPDPALGRVKADPAQLGQVLLNLAINARDAMPRGGRLTVTTANADVSAAAARPDLPPGRYAVLSVADTGTGIPPDVLPHLFEPFFTTKPVGQGTGLGLATVYGVVTQSGGHVTVESTVGVGTTFRVYLPRVEEAPPPPPAAPGRAPRGTETVLVVEDEPDVRRMTRMILEHHGYAVLEAADGRAGLDVLTAHPGPVHLLVTDLVMPRMSGRELAEAAAAVRPATRVLYVSGYTEDEVVRQGVEAAAVDFLHKPFGLDALGRKVREVLDRP